MDVKPHSTPPDEELERAVALFSDYVSDPLAFWTGLGRRQGDKLVKRARAQCAHHSIELPELVERITTLARRRLTDRPAPVYVTGLGGSGSHWLAGMLTELPQFAFVGEVYFHAPRFDEGLRELSPAAQAYLADCVHLIHCRAQDIHDDVAIVNNGRGERWYQRFRSWDPDCFIIHLVRDPRDQVLSVTFRKQEFREYQAPGASDLEYLARMARRNATASSVFRRDIPRADFLCRYEALKSQPRVVIGAILDGIGAGVDPEDIDRVVDVHDAASIRERGEAPATSNLYLGSGSRDWSDTAAPWQKWILHSELVDVVIDESYRLDHCLGRPVPGPGLPGDVVVEFPEDRSVGVLHVQQPGSSEAGWQVLGDARGPVRLPAGHIVRLRPGPGDFDLDALTAIGTPAVHVLCLAGLSDVADADLEAVAALPGLREVDLSRTPITDAGLPALEDAQALTGISLWDCQVSDEAVAGLRRALPDALIARGASDFESTEAEHPVSAG